MIIRLKRPMTWWRYRHRQRPLTPKLRHDYQAFNTHTQHVTRCSYKGVVTAIYGHRDTIRGLAINGWAVCFPVGDILLPEGI